MSPDRWQRLQAAFEQARAYHPEDRAQFLLNEYPEDEDLRRQVTQMLALDSEGKILDTPAFLRPTPTPGEMIGPYRIERPLGSGGMGHVFEATDTRLNRAVAMKFSRTRFHSRFRREATAVASLNHSNICTLYDIGEDYLVMEFVKGVTLSQRLAQGPMAFDEVRRIAKSLAEAIDVAHEGGVIHRDLKPGNIMVRWDGVVKILDFGLAKLVDSGPDGTMDPSSLTLSQEMGIVLGTAAYMAPEQAMGKSVDKRADVYAFGAVLFEMVAGERLHKGETTTEVLASVIKEEPPWEKVPASFERLLRRCLAKDPRQRLRSLADAVDLALDGDLGQEERAPKQEPVEMPQPAPAATPVRAAKPSRRLVWVTILAVAGLVAIARTAWYAYQGWDPSPETVRFQILEDGKYKLQNAATMVSPDGRWLAFQAVGTDGKSRIWLRALDSLESRPIQGTETVNTLQGPPFWSPDSKTIVFGNNPAPFAAGQMMRVDIAGGSPRVICETSSGLGGAAWGPDGTIVFLDSAKRYLEQVPATGGVPTAVTLARSGDRFHLMPQFLPDGRTFLYYRRTDSPRTGGIYIGSLDKRPEEQDQQPILLTERQAYYSPVGGDHLLFVRGETAFAQPFDLRSLRLTGEPVAIADSVTSFTPAGVARFSVSKNGVLAYNAGATTVGRAVLFYRYNGMRHQSMNSEYSSLGVEISPDSRQVAFAVADLHTGGTSISVSALRSGGGKRQVAYAQGRAGNPVWSPDGQYIAYASNRNGFFDLYLTKSDGSGPERLLLKSQEDKIPTSWSVDGFLMYTTGVTGNQDIWLLPHPEQPGPQAIPYLNSSSDDSQGRFSPDGKWVAYSVTEFGRSQIYVRRFDPAHIADSTNDQRWRITRVDGAWPSWALGGREITYAAGGSVVAQDFDPQEPGRLEEHPEVLIPGFAGDFVISPDGALIIEMEIPRGEVPGKLVVVKNWHAALRLDR